MNKQELLKKVKALADFGVGGEKENAQRILAELMKKYNISEEELCEEVVKEFEIKIPKVFKAHELAVQTFYSVVGCKNENKFFSRYKDKNKRFVFCTSAEFIEFEAKYKFYLHYLKKESERFYGAFVQVNKIFPPISLQRENTEQQALTNEDMEVLKMAANLEKHDYHLQIEDEVII